MPLCGQFVVHRLGLAKFNLHTTFEFPIFTRYKDIKGNAKCRNWGGWGFMARQKSLALSPFDEVHMTSCSTLIKSIHLS